MNWSRVGNTLGHFVEYCTVYDQFNPKLTIINILLTISIDCREVRLWDTKWSPNRKCLDLLSNSLNTLFKEVYGDQFGAVWSVWRSICICILGLKGLKEQCSGILKKYKQHQLNYKFGCKFMNGLPWIFKLFWIPFKKLCLPSYKSSHTKRILAKFY